jgi:hypothetical protein
MNRRQIFKSLLGCAVLPLFPEKEATSVEEWPINPQISRGKSFEDLVSDNYRNGHDQYNYHIINQNTFRRQMCIT